MEITIEEAIEVIEYLKTQNSQLKSIDVVIETIRKYQKIKEIMNELNGDFYGSYLKDRQTLEKIWEVIDNGNE